MSEEPRVNKTKEEVLADMKKNVDFQKKMTFIKEKFWPALCEASQNIEDAGILLQGFGNMIMQEFLGMMKERKLTDLKLQLKLDVQNDKYLENQKLLELFEDLNVFEAREYIEGMRSEIETFKADEMKSRPLSSLKTKWIDEI